jgi:tRNA uridine 5-carboxymethylaminomethyl modification enzyme
MRETSFSPDEVNPWLEEIGTDPIRQKLRMINILTRPQVGLFDMISNVESVRNLIGAISNDPEVIEQAEINVKYEGYLEREFDLAQKMNRLEDVRIFR